MSLPIPRHFSVQPNIHNLFIASNYRCVKWCVAVSVEKEVYVHVHVVVNIAFVVVGGVVVFVIVFNAECVYESFDSSNYLQLFSQYPPQFQANVSIVV